MAERNYWVRTEQGRTWGPYPLAALERLRGQLTEKSEASIDGKEWRPGTEFPELRDLLVQRKVESKGPPVDGPPPPPRISKAIAEAFGIKPEIASPPAEQKETAQPAPSAPKSQPAPSRPKPQPQQPPPPVAEKPLEMPESGDLAEQSPVRLYAIAALTSASGWLALELEKGRMLQISFRRGTPEHLSTDDPDHSVVRFLVQRGIVAGPSAVAAEEQATKTGQDIVSVLFQLQLIPPGDAHQLLGDYARYLLDRAIVSWRGKFSFEKDAPPPPGAFPMGSRWTLLAESVRRADVPILRARLGKRLLRPVVRSGGMGIGRVEELSLNALESRSYAAIDGTRTGEELLKAQDAGAVVRLLYLLTELGHLSFVELHEEEDMELPPPSLEPAAPVAAPASGKPRELPKVARAAARPDQPRALRGEPPRLPKMPAQSAPPVAKAAAPAPAKPTAPAPAKPAAPVQQPISRPPPAWAAAPGDESPEAAMLRLSALLERLLAADHFEVLGMDRKTASSAEAKRNFFVLAKELHPDTVSDPSLVELRDLKERLFSRINEAAQVLSDDKRRKEYEEELEGKKNNVDVARIFAAEENFQRAEIMIKARKYQEGLDLIEKALSMNDQEAEFYAWRGYAKFLLARDRKEAYEECAAECRKAIKMIPKCVPAHLFLGHMSKVVGDLKLAQRCYQEVVALDPNHIEAQRELRLMGKK